MSNIQITKVKLIKGGEKLEVAYKESGDVSASADKTCDNVVHADLKKAVDGLACHLAIQTDYLTEKRAMDKDELEKFVVSGYSIGGKDEEEGIVITGYRRTRAGRTVTLNTPFLKLDSDPKIYYLIDDLNTRIKKIEKETELYLGGKKAPDPQTSLDFPENKEEKVTKIKIEHPADPKNINGQFNAKSDEKLNGKKKLNSKQMAEILSPVMDKAIAQGDIKKVGNKKKVAQSADAPSGEVD